MKLWEKDKITMDEVMTFTVGNDPQFDKLLAPYDVVGSLAHAIMLIETGLISGNDGKLLIKELVDYYAVTKNADFTLNPEDEDIHSHLENYLIKKTGDAGKKIHTARSRNDQVMIAIQLMMKEEWRLIIEGVGILFNALTSQAEKYKSTLIPGYTHTQVAMPSSIGLWLGAYAESLINDMILSGAIIKMIDQNPLGSAAGYGSSFPIDREKTRELAGFSELLVSSVSVQLNRGKMEASMAFGLSSFASTMARLASDMILFTNQNFNFISFPDELTTGSSIMPHKKNPDVLELIRAHCNVVNQLPNQLINLTTNLNSGYHRDFQLSKELLFPGIDKIKQCLRMLTLMVSNMIPREGILDDEKYTYIFSVEEVNRKVMDGLSFRDAYREVVDEIERGTYKANRNTTYSHIGSIGNPGIEKIKNKMEKVKSSINIQSIDFVFNKMKDYLK